MNIIPQSGHGTADSRVRLGRSTVWVDGWTPAGPDALAAALVAHGPTGVAHWPGDWAAVLHTDGTRESHVVVDAFGGRTLYTDGSRVADRPELLGDLRDYEVDPSGMEAQLTGWIDDPTRTLIRGIWRVAAGYGGAFGGSVQLRPMYHPRVRVPQRPALSLRAIVETSVTEHLSVCSGVPRVALSGGLDSSVLAGLLADRTPIRALSNRFVGWSADEGRFIDAVCALHGLDRTDVDSRSLDPLEVLELLGPPGFPPVLVNHHLNLALMRESGGALWTGFGGDEVFGHGLEVVRELVQSGHPVRAAWEAVWLARRFRHGEMGVGQAYRMWAGRWARSMLPDRLRRTQPRSSLQGRLGTLGDPLIGRSREEQRRLAALVGVDLMMPLLDPRIAEVCLGLPARRMVRRGRTRRVVREAFSDLLPRLVSDRADKADLSRSLDQRLHDAMPEVDLALLRPWRKRSDIDALRAGCIGGCHDSAADWFRLVGASRWLKWHTGRE